MNPLIIITVVTAIGLFFGLLIYLANSRLPHREKVIEIPDTTEKPLPEKDCKAVIYCGGMSEVIYKYHGVKSCRAASRLLGGFKRCPYACLGLGDCIDICPKRAISINNKDIATIDYDKCDGCGLCIDECVRNLIELVPAETQIDFRCSYSHAENITSRERCQYAEEFISKGVSPTIR
jgi:ferredoxin